MHNIALRNALDRWEDIQEAAHIEVKKFEEKANDKLNEQRKRFHDDRVLLHARIDGLLDNNAKLEKKIEMLSCERPELNAAPHGKRKRKVSLDTDVTVYASETSEEEFTD